MLPLLLGLALPALGDANTDVDTDADSDPPASTGDTSADGPDGPDDRGCGCSTGQLTSAASLSLGLLLLGVTRRRR
jgi:uncharacterized protein (TIGR03382 family)